MPRAAYIYVVRQYPLKSLVAAFTVKHELVTWLRRRLVEAPLLVDLYLVTRLRDGQGPETALHMGTARQVIDGA
jgi:hypothetical protein